MCYNHVNSSEQSSPRTNMNVCSKCAMNGEVDLKGIALTSESTLKYVHNYQH